MSTTRRQWLAQGASVVAGIALTGCNALDTSAARSTVPAAAGTDDPSLPTTRIGSGPVFIDGRRVRTIDVHSHCYVAEALAMMGSERDAVLPPVKGVPEHFIVVEERLRTMDLMRVDMEILSINPFWYRRERDAAERIVRLQNQKLAELCSKAPQRLGAFATLPLQFPDLAVQVLTEAMTVHGLRGAAIGSNVNGIDFSDPQFFPVWEAAQALGATLFIHPISAPELAKRYRGNGWLSNTIGNPLDTTIALSKLIFEGTLDRFPKLKICAAHGGGYLGSYGMRGDRSCFISPQNCDPKIVLQKKPSEYLKQITFDSLVFTPEALRHLVAQVGASQVVIGTDHPIPWELHPVDHVLNTPNLSNAERSAILGGNAARLLGLSG